MKIAEVSRRYDISADTLRYYERIGILRHVPRNASGIRDYDESSCRTVEFVKCMRDAGMSIEALAEYMELLDQGEQTVPQRKALLVQQRDRIEERVQELQKALARLDYKIEHYEETVAVGENAIREAGEVH